jgi:leucyl-tRNA synthetase
LINTVSKFDVKGEQDRAVIQESLDSIVLMLAPIVPHICHRLWHLLGHESAVTDEAWPAIDADAAISDMLQIIVQVNGKLRARLQLPANASKQDLEDAARADQNVQRFIADRQIRKVIVVPGKLVNVVI